MIQTIDIGPNDEVVITCDADKGHLRICHRGEGWNVRLEEDEMGDALEDLRAATDLEGNPLDGHR